MRSASLPENGRGLLIFGHATKKPGRTSPIMSDRVFQETGEFNVIFIHSSLDDIGLTPQEFRILAHLARRSNTEKKAWPGIDSMAKICRMHKETVIECIRTLETYKMIVVERKPGCGNIYRLTSPSKWDVSEMGNGRNGGTEPVGNGERQRSERGNERKSREGESREGNPIPPSSPGLASGSLEADKIAPSNPVAIRIAACIGRQASTAWSPKEVKAFKALVKAGVNEEDLVAVEVYYRTNRKLPRNICRRDLLTLLNNFPGEVDRAKAWVDQQSGRTPRTPKPPRHDDDETF